MNDPSSSGAEAHVPSMMPFVGLESGGCTAQKQQLWDWETTNHNTSTAAATTHLSQLPTVLDATTVHHPLLAGAGGGNSNPYFDCPSSLLQQPTNTTPITTFPFYSPLDPGGLVKMEDGDRSAAPGTIGLNLGHRTYFSSGDAVAIDRLFRRSRGLYQLNHNIPRCQAGGCKADLSGAKHYHRRHKVCEFHSKASVVVAGGLQQRFCQQCSRFHVLAEFDEAKRSCRKRLADHNRRRRRSQPGPPPPLASSTTATVTDSQRREQIRAACRGVAAAPTTSSQAAASISTISSGDGSPYKKNKTTHVRSCPALTLGGAENGEDLGSNTSYHHHHRHQQQQQCLSPPSPTTNLFHQHRNLSSSSPAEPSVSTTGVSGGSSADRVNLRSSHMLHLGQQGLFEVDFI